MLEAQSSKEKKKKEYSMEVVEAAESLYIYKQKTHEEIAQLTGVSVAQIQRWSEKYEWRKKKMDQLRKRLDYRHTLYSVRDDMLAEARTTKDPQKIHALAALQKLIEGEEKVAFSDDQTPNPEVFLRFMRDLVVFLKDRDPAALTELEKNFDEFITFAKEKYAKV